MKKLIMVTIIAACVALCAVVWPQSKAPKETPAPHSTTTVCAPEAAIVELRTEAETALSSEKEKEVVLLTEAPTEIPTEPGPALTETPLAPEVQPTPEPEMTSKPAPEPAPEPTLQPIPELPATQRPAEPQTGDMVYVPGFGWIENQGPNRVEFAADMYENGNKIGIMG